ncbi:porin [Candidatus Pelagibacter sp.]|nr:porin [Candidatus Pelagibacter sp.]
MNNFKKIGLTALAGSLIATSAFAGSMSVGGSAGIGYTGQSNKTNANGWSSGDSLTFTGSGELDNGMSVTTYQEIDGGVLDDRYISIEMDGLGKLTFNAHGGSSAMSAVDDTTPTAYGESWDLIGSTAEATAGLASKEGAIGGFATDNSFFYDMPEMVEGLDVNVSYTPSGTADATTKVSRPDGTVSWALAYTGVEGLTVGYAVDDNGYNGTSKLETEVMHATYAFGSFTVGFTESEQDQSGATASDDEFSAHGITYQVSDDLTIGYNASERQFGDKTADQESKALSVSYTSGGMTIAAAHVSMDNVGGSTAAVDDVDGYAIDISFAF